MEFKFHYSSESDVLSIYNYDKLKPEESIEISEYLVLDIDKDNRVIGLEIFDASEFFGAFNKQVNKDFLTNLEGVEIQQREMRNNWFLVIGFKSEDKIIYQPMPPLRKSEYISPLLA